MHMLRLFGEIRQTFFAYESFKLSLITRTVSATLVCEMLSAQSREIYLSIHVCALNACNFGDAVYCKHAL